MSEEYNRGYNKCLKDVQAFAGNLALSLDKEGNDVEAEVIRLLLDYIHYGVHVGASDNESH